MFYADANTVPLVQWLQGAKNEQNWPKIIWSKVVSKDLQSFDINVDLVKNKTKYKQSVMPHPIIYLYASLVSTITRKDMHTYEMVWLWMCFTAREWWKSVQTHVANVLVENEMNWGKFLVWKWKLNNSAISKQFLLFYYTSVDPKWLKH